MPFREPLDGSPNQALIAFECLYESYDADAQSPAAWRPGQADSGNQLSWQSLPKNRYNSPSRDRDGRDGHGILSVRVIAAYNLINTDTGFFGDVSDPYVTIRLESQSEKQQKRTHTINNDLNPRWNSSPFLFQVEHLGKTICSLGDVSEPRALLRPKNLHRDDSFQLRMAEDQLLLEVWDEDMMQSSDFLGRMKIPLYKIVHGRANQPILVRDQLQDNNLFVASMMQRSDVSDYFFWIVAMLCLLGFCCVRQDVQSGELEVEIGFSPG